MTPKTKHRLLLLTALFHLFADVAFAGGAVFCVGVDDHRAVELEHASAMCQGASNAVDAAAVAAPDSTCIDSPLHCSPELVGSADDGSDTGPTLIALPAAATRLSSEQSLGNYARAAISLPGLQTHRTTVLRL